MMTIFRLFIFIFIGIWGICCLAHIDEERNLAFNPTAWSGINALLSTLTIQTGSFSTSGGNSFAGYSLTVPANGVVCKGLSVTGVSLSTVPISTTEVDSTLSLSGFTVSCQITFSYTITAVWITGSPTTDTVTVPVKPTTISSVLNFASTNINTAPLSSVTIKSCSASVSLGTISENGASTITNDIISGLQSLLSGTITSYLNTELCTLLNNEVTSLFPPLVASYNTWAKPLLLPLPAVPAAILEATAAKALPPGIQLLSWNQLGVFNLLSTQLLNPLAGSSASDSTSTLGQLDAIIQGAVGQAGINAGLNALLYSGSNSYAGASVTLSSFNIVGLDTLQTAKLLQLVPGSNYTLDTQLQWGSLQITAVFAISVSTGSGASATVQTNSVTVVVGFSNIVIDIEVIVAMNEAFLLNTNIGSIINDPEGCVLEAIPLIQVVKLSVGIGSITGPTISNFVDPGFNGLTNNAISAFQQIQLKVLLATLPQISNTYGLGLVNTEIVNYLNPLRKCPVYIPPVTSATAFPSLPLSTSTLFKAALAQVDKYIGGGSLDFGSIMDKLLAPNPGSPVDGINGVSGVFGTIGSETSPIGSYNIPLGTAGTLNIVFTTLIMYGLDQFDTGSQLLTPITDSLLHTDAFLAANSTKLNFTLGVDLFVTGGLLAAAGFTGPSNLRDNLEISIGLEGVHIALNLTTDFNEANLYNSTINTIATNPLCLLKSMQIWGFTELTATFGMGFMKIKCIQCSSTGLIPIINKLESLSSLQALVDFLNSSLFKTGTKGSGVLRNLMKWLDQVVYNAVNPLLLPLQCPHEMGDYQPQGMWLPLTMMSTAGNSSNIVSNPSVSTAPVMPSFTWPSGIIIIIIGVCLVNGFLLLLYLIYAIRRSRKAKDVIAEKEYSGPALFMHPNVPLVVKICMPLVLVGEMFLFYSAHTYTGASFDVYINFAGETIQIQNFYQVTLAMTVQQTLQSGSYALAFLVGLMSGIWPYVKIELLIFCWFCPPKWFGKVERNTLLNILDALGKWSQVDLYVMVLLMVAFNLQITTPGGFQGVFDEGFIAAHLQLDPQWGIYGFVLAVMIAILSNQVMVWYNRKTNREVLNDMETRRQTVDVTYNNDATDRSAALFAHHFETKDGINFMQYGTGGVFFVTGLILLCGSFVLWGSLGNSLGFKYQGLVAAGVSWGGGINATVPDYSIVTMTAVLSKQEGVNPYGMFFLQASVFFFTLLAPLLFVFILLTMWLMRLTVTNQEKLLYIAEIVRDWCCLDVYVVAYVVTLLEVGHLAAYLGGSAAPICTFFGQLAIGGDDEICFALSAYPELPGIPVICVSVLLLWLIQYIILSGTRMAVRDREPHEHFKPGHKPSSAFVDSVVENNTGLRRSLFVAKYLPSFILRIGWIKEDGDGGRKYTSTMGSEESFPQFVARKVSLNNETHIEHWRDNKFDKPDMSFKRPNMNKKLVKSPSFTKTVDLEIIDEHFDGKKETTLSNPISNAGRLVDDDELSSDNNKSYAKNTFDNKKPNFPPPNPKKVTKETSSSKKVSFPSMFESHKKSNDSFKELEDEDED